MLISQNQAGSVYPDNSLIQDQLSPSSGSIQAISSLKTKGGVAPLWSKAVIDLTRLGTLQVNGETVYAKHHIPAPDGMDAVTYVFQKLESQLDSTTLATRAANLMQQDVEGEALRLVVESKGLSKRVSGDIVSSYSVLCQGKITVLNADHASFTLNLESLVVQRNLDDPEHESYFKVKTIIQGPLNALEMRDSSKISIKAAYTQTVSTKEEAYKANYFGTQAGGLFHYQSYIKRPC